MATNFTVKWAKSAYSFSFVTLAFQNSLECRQSDFKRFIFDERPKVCANLLNIGPVTSEFKNGKIVQPRVSFFKVNLSDKVSQDPLDHFLPNFHHMVGI